MNYENKNSQPIWHPFTQMKTAESPVKIVRGQGVFVYDEQDQAYLDAISSWWVNLHGHCHPHIVKAVKNQIETLDHVIFAGYTHPKAVELADRLVKVLPESQTRVFFSDNGSTAVEVGIKMAIQYHFNKKAPRRKIISFAGGYHGDTFGAMAVSGRSKFTEPFLNHLFEVEYIPYPVPGQEERCVEAFKDILKTNDVAAFIYEPLVQGVNGFQVGESAVFSELIAMCRDQGVISIADEVMTGFGRTGSLFASEQISHKPDIMCLSKGITGGTMALSVTTCSDQIFEGFYDDQKEKAFLHGHSYTANPIACAAACASLDLTLSDECRNQRQMISQTFSEIASTLKDHPSLTDIRVKGCILALEIKDSQQGYFSSLASHFHRFFKDKHMLLRPLGNVIYMIPPYTITRDQIFETASVMVDSLEVIDV